MQSRRQFLETSVWAATAGLVLPQFALAEDKPALKLAPFRFDVSPPEGHPLCGGWIKPVAGMDDAEEAIGLLITGVGEPIVICAVDWTGLLNRAHFRWRQALAQAAGTSAAVGFYANCSWIHPMQCMRLLLPFE